jgi:multidrug resistance efflux pump
MHTGTLPWRRRTCRLEMPESSREPKNLMPSKKPIVALVVLVIAGALAAGAWWYRHDQAQQPDAIVLHGNVDIRQVELAFNANGRIEQVLAAEGDRVTKGQLLAVLDTERLRRVVAEAQARVAAQRQVVARLEAGSRPEEIRKAQADVQAARVDVANAQANYRRQQDLVAEHFVAQQQVDNAKFALDAAQARLTAVEEALRLVELGPRKEDIKGARATLAAYEATLALAQRDLQEGSLYAPSDGVIENRILEPGDMASPQRPVLTLALTQPLWVRAYVSEPDLGKIHLGTRAQVSTDSFPGKRYRGWIGFISPSAQFTPKSVETQEVRTSLVYQVRVFVCDPQQQLRLGMPASVFVPLDQPPASPPGPGEDPCKDAP